MQECTSEFEPFSHDELQEAMSTLKPGKAAGLDNISTEMIQHFGPNALAWILEFTNSCAVSFSTPQIWRRAKVVALLKPSKDPEHPKSYRPISLLCILYKLYERMVMARISPTVEEQLTPDQAGFRSGRSTCDQLLNLTQHIEDGYDTN